MTPSDDSIADGRALLERALADPFILLSDEEAQEPPTHVDDWFRFLMEQFPLWAFQADEYRKFHSSALGTTYPLGQFLYSMLLDEGVKDSVPLDPLPAEVEERRLDLADPTGIQLPAWKATHAQRYGQPHATSRPRPRFLPDRVSNLDETNVGAGRLKVFLWWRPFIKYIIPIAVAVILLGGILKAVGR